MLREQRVESHCIPHTHAAALQLGHAVPVLESPPTALEFHRSHVAPGRPVLIRNAVGHWDAMRKWTWSYLASTIGADRRVTVAVTPDGRADAPLLLGEAARQGLLGEAAWHALKEHDPRELHLFVTPHEAQMTLSELEASFRAAMSEDADPAANVHYVQLQNDNLRGEWSALLRDVDEARFPFAEEAFGCKPEAVNLWLGDARSVTALHKDHYENLYVVVCGRKHFTLYPPVDYPFLYEEPCVAAAYRPNDEGRLELHIDNIEARVPWIVVRFHFWVESNFVFILLVIDGPAQAGRASLPTVGPRRTAPRDGQRGRDALSAVALLSPRPAGGDGRLGE